MTLADVPFAVLLKKEKKESSAQLIFQKNTPPTHNQYANLDGTGSDQNKFRRIIATFVSMVEKEEET